MKTSHSPSLNKREAQGTHTQKKKVPWKAGKKTTQGEDEKKKTCGSSRLARLGKENTYIYMCVYKRKQKRGPPPPPSKGSSSFAFVHIFVASLLQAPFRRQSLQPARLYLALRTYTILFFIIITIFFFLSFLSFSGFSPLYRARLADQQRERSGESALLLEGVPSAFVQPPSRSLFSFSYSVKKSKKKRAGVRQNA